MNDKQYYNEYRDLILELKDYIWERERDVLLAVVDNLDDRLNEILDECVEEAGECDDGGTYTFSHPLANNDYTVCADTFDEAILEAEAMLYDDIDSDTLPTYWVEEISWHQE